MRLVLSDSTIVFKEDQSGDCVVLKEAQNGWWESLPESPLKLRVRLEGVSRLGIQHWKNDAWSSGFMATSGALAAARLCYKNSLLHAGRTMSSVIMPQADSKRSTTSDSGCSLGALFGLGRAGQGCMQLLGDLHEPEVCVVCLSEPANICFGPCSHCVVCAQCETKLKQRKCPICRCAIEGTVKLAWGAEVEPKSKIADSLPPHYARILQIAGLGNL